MIFSKYPFLRLTFCFALGIVSYHYLGGAVMLGWSLLITLIICYVWLTFKDSLKYQFVLSLLAFCILFGLGAKRLQYFKGESHPDHLLNITQPYKAYKAVVRNSPEQKDNSLKVELEVYSIYNVDQWSPAIGLVNAYLDKERAKTIQYGDLIYVNSPPQLTSPPANPGEFDYKAYLIYNRIHHQQFVGDRFKIIGHTTPNWFVSQSIRWRALCTQRLKALVQNEDAQAVTLALVLGVKEELQDDLIRAFSATGAMHILAVSGLHVGIIYGIVFLLLKYFGFAQRRYRWYLAAISVTVLWGYALLTGLSPSVLRAVTMFSFVAIGRAMFRHGNIFNTLAASAMALLLYNPYLIMSVGFQLSYLAVFGIVYLQPKLYALITVHNRLLDKVWAITCVSLAAQLATAPLSILYFHQFPTYFLISNLFIIPAAFIILLGGVLLLALSAVPIMATALGWSLTKFVLAINGLVVWVSEWPGSTIEGIYFSILDTWLVYGVLTMIVLLCVRKRSIYLKWAVSMALAFSISQLVHLSGFSNNRELSVLDVSGASLLDIRSGFDSRLLADSTLDYDRLRFHLLPKRLVSGNLLTPGSDRLILPQTDLLFGSIMSFDGKVILVVNKEIPDRFSLEDPLRVDKLILSNDAVKDLSPLIAQFDFDQLIIDASNSWYTDSKLMKQSKLLDLNCYSVRQNGYYSEVWRSNL